MESAGVQLAPALIEGRHKHPQHALEMFIRQIRRPHECQVFIHRRLLYGKLMVLHNLVIVWHFERAKR